MSWQPLRPRPKLLTHEHATVGYSETNPNTDHRPRISLDHVITYCYTNIQQILEMQRHPGGSVLAQHTTIYNHLALVWVWMSLCHERSQSLE